MSAALNFTLALISTPDETRVSMDELTEKRARQRTFEGAYARTALSNLAYALTILRLFDRRFFKIGLLYSAMAVLILLCAYIRTRFVTLRQGPQSDFELATEACQQLLTSSRAIRTVGHENKRLIGPAFVSAGRVVVLVALVVAATELTLAALIFQL